MGISEVPALFSTKNLEVVLQDMMKYFQEDQIGEHVGVDEAVHRGGLFIHEIEAVRFA